MPAAVWFLLDRDGDGELNALEYHNVVKAMDHGLIQVIPWALYSPLETRHYTQFRVKEKWEDATSDSYLAVIPAANSTLPFLRDDWQLWYNLKIANSTASGMTFNIPTPGDVSKRTNLISMNTTDLPESLPFAIPMATTREKIPLKKHVDSFDKHVTTRMSSKLFGENRTIEATKQLPDVVHVFNQDSEEKVLPITHLAVAGDELVDNTAKLVNGMVRFPSDTTQNIICGLQYAKITAYQGKKCSSDEMKIGAQCSPAGYKYNSPPSEYVADVLGKFEMSFTPGETWALVASYEGHTLCYGGDRIDARVCESKDISDGPVKFKDDVYATNVFIELVEIVGGEFITFYDVTKRQVDVGLYAGACGTPYKGYELLVSAANGCGIPQVVKDSDIVDNQHGKWKKVDPADSTSNVRHWPFAPMDYYIQLNEAPDVSALDEDRILAQSPSASCKPGINILQFFRDRGLIVQTMSLLALQKAEVRYVYHGWFCAIAMFGNSRDAATDAFTHIRKDELCLGDEALERDLTKEHLIGNTNTEYSHVKAKDVSKEKYVSYKVQEVHWTDGASANPISYCSKFSDVVNGNPTALSVNAVISEDVGPQGSNNCHSSNVPTSECTSNQVDVDSGLLYFKNEENEQVNAFKISSKDALPNLVKPHRRDVKVRIERNDGWAITTLNVDRELVTLASKIRGSGGDATARYRSDTKFYATAPIRGLVYTVVHDPPGGNSYASIEQGTEITLNLNLQITRGASRSTFSDDSDSSEMEFEMDLGADFGASYANADLLPESNILYFRQQTDTDTEYTGPQVGASATMDNGWDLRMTLDRNIVSSTDAGIPGRPGDVILGGGFEIVYVRTDTIDIRDNCLAQVNEVQWFPRKPTSYVIQIYTIEERIIPELEDLIRVANNKTSIMTDGEMGEKSNTEVKGIWLSRLVQTVDDWKRTIEWASPDYNPEGFYSKSSAEQKSITDDVQSKWENINVALSSDESVFGQIAKPRIDVALGSFAQDSELSDYTAKDDWTTLTEVWNSVTSESLPVKGIPGIRRDDEYAEMDGWDANEQVAADKLGAAFCQTLCDKLGVDDLNEKTAKAQEFTGIQGVDCDTIVQKCKDSTEVVKVVAGIFKLLTGIDIMGIYKMEDSVANPNPQGYMDEIALKNIINGEELESRDGEDKWDKMRSQLPMKPSKVKLPSKKEISQALKSAAKKATKEAVKEGLERAQKHVEEVVLNAVKDKAKELIEREGAACFRSRILGEKVDDDTLCGGTGVEDKFVSMAEETGIHVATELTENLTATAENYVNNTLLDGLDDDEKEWVMNCIRNSTAGDPEKCFPEGIEPEPANMTSEKLANWVLDPLAFINSFGNAVDGKSLFLSVENDEKVVPGSLFSRGMSNAAFVEMKRRSGMQFNKDFFSGNQASAMIDASMFGTKTEFGFGPGSIVQDPQSDPLPSGEMQNIYLTFSGGGHSLEFSSDISDNIDGASFSWKFDAQASASADVTMDYTIIFIENTLNQKTSFSKHASVEQAQAWSKYGKLKTTYSLGDADPFDKFVVSVSTDKRFGTPTFRTIGGASMCPGEPNTMWRENGMQLSLSASAGMNNRAIPPGKSALYDITITNESPYREPVAMGLSLTQSESYTGAFGANVLDLPMSVSGDWLTAYGGPLSLGSIPSVNSNRDLIHSKFTLRIDRGAFAHEFKDVALKLVSECEFNLASSSMYRAAISSNDANLGTFKWEYECPKVSWDVKTYNDYGTTLKAITKDGDDQGVIKMNIRNPDASNLWSKDLGAENGRYDHLVHPNVAKIQIEWRRTGRGEWISAWNSGSTDNWSGTNCSASRSSGCAFNWDINNQYFFSGNNDGEYEIRSKIYCKGYDAFASSDVRGSVTDVNLKFLVDVEAPIVKDIVVVDRVVSIEYSEEVTCPQLSDKGIPYEIKRVGKCDGTSVSDEEKVSLTRIIADDYKFLCLPGDRGSLLIQFPDVVEAGTYEITINGNMKDSADKKIVDVGENPAKKQKFRVVIGSSCKSVAETNDAANISSRSSIGLGLARSETTETKIRKNVKISTKSLGETKFEEYNISASTLLFGFVATVVFSAGVVYVALSPSRSRQEGERASYLSRFLRRPTRSETFTEDDALFATNSNVAPNSVSVTKKTYGSVI